MVHVDVAVPVAGTGFDGIIPELDGARHVLGEHLIRQVDAGDGFGKADQGFELAGGGNHNLQERQRNEGVRDAASARGVMARLHIMVDNSDITSGFRDA